MNSPAFGGAAVGLVWGSLAGGRVFRVVSLPAPMFVICTATLVLAAEMLFLTDWRSVPAFLGAATFGLIAQFAWLYWLKSRSGD